MIGAMDKNTRFAPLLLRSALMTAAASVASAQTPDDVEPEAIEEVLVVGVKNSIINAIENKRNETRVTDSIQAEDLGEFPDINLAQSLQRVPGVTLERAANGASRTLTVRGLSSQFTRVEINGMGAATGGGGRAGLIDPSTRGFGNDGRGFNFDVLPSELFTEAVVAKSPQARDNEGGIAALIELSTPSPFDVGDGAGSLALQGNWGEASGAAPRLSGIFSKHLNEKLAVLVGGVYTENLSNTTTVGYQGFEPLGSIVGNPGDFSEEQQAALLSEGVRNYVRDRETENVSFLGTLEWRPGFGRVRFDALYSTVDGTEQEVQAAYSLNGAVATELGIQGGVARSGQFAFGTTELEFQSDNPEDTLQQYTLDIDVDLGRFLGATWSVNPFMGYNERETKRPFRQLDFFGAGGTLALDGSTAVDGFSVTGPPSLSDDPAAFRLANAFVAGNENASDETNVELNVAGSFDSPFLSTVRLGVRYVDRTSSVDEPFFGQLNFGPAPTLGDAPGLGSEDFDFSGGGGNLPGSIYFLDVADATTFFLGGQNILDQESFDLGQSLLDAPFVIGSAVSNALARSTVAEEISAAYVEADFSVGKLDFNAGVRIVETKVDATGGLVVNGQPSAVSVSESYTETLPALNARYNFTDELLIRAAASRALSRPSLAALAPRETIGFDPLNPANSGGSRGNPGLEPFVVDQYDIGFEWYFHEEGLLAFTYFAKDFSSLIASEQVLLPRVLPDENGVETEFLLEFTQPFNSGEGEVTGWELTAQSSLYFLGERLSDFGLLLNYTDLESEAEIESEDGSQLQPFPNLSPSSLNAGLYYDNGVFDTRINYAWREGFLLDALDPAGDFPFQEDFGQLDLTMNYAFNESLNLQLQALNLLDEALEFTNSQSGVPLNEINLERRVIFGLRYSF